MWLAKHPDPTSRMMKWALLLQPYDMTIIYGKGADNVVADCLSRMRLGDDITKNEYQEWTHITETVPTDPDWETTVLVACPIITFRNDGQTQTNGPRDENWVGRDVEVLGHFLGVAGLNSIDVCPNIFE